MVQHPIKIPGLYSTSTAVPSQSILLLLVFQDKAELGCLRAIVLFNPVAKGLEAAASAQVETLREKVYATLEEYTRLNNENEPSRFVCREN